MVKAARSPVRSSSQARSARAGPAFELLESKLRAPQHRGRAVPRGELIDLLEGASGAGPVVFVSAGPGWGKTTLLAQWAARSRRPFAWVSVDANDNDPIVLLTYVAVALDRVSCLEASVFEALASPGVSVEGTVVPRLGAALATMDDAVLVLDDLHLLENQSCLDAIEALAGHVSNGSQMTLSARGGPIIPLGALRARGLALEIGPPDLRMNEAQARQLLRAAGVELSAEQVTELTEHTEGWPAGIYLAALSIRARGVKAAGAAVISGSDRLVSDYLQSELLAHLSANDVRFLTRTAVLERMSGPLCDAVLEATGSAAILESRSRSNLFLVPLDAHRQWYRYHHLFQELLRAELVRAEPELVPRLLARAADWCEANGQPEAAIGYVQEAGDVDRAARLFVQSAIPMYESGQVATAERWLHWLERNGSTGAQCGDRRARRDRGHDPGPASRGGALGRSGRTRQLRRPPARRQCLDRLLAGRPACRALSGRGGENARGCGVGGPDARALESFAAERTAVLRAVAVAGRRGRRGRRRARRRRRGGPRAGRGRGGGGGSR